MKVSYQRELYRSRMCCELEKEESSYGYPLQMCLRNSIPGLLPCSAELMDGRTYLCWDITSRNSLKELSGGGFTLELLERVLRAVYAVMQELDGYLISSGYLVLLPEQIYLDASRKKVEFICDYGDEASFQTGMMKLAEYVLAGIDHKDQEQMRLGYGLYRLAVQENFSRGEFQYLLFVRKRQEEPSLPGGAVSERRFGRDTVYTEASVRGEMELSEIPPEDTTTGETERQKILDSFFRDDEEIKQGIREYLPLYALLAAVAVLGLEIFFYFRNGRHIHPGWLACGFLLTAICTGAACIGQHIKGKEKTEDSRKEKSSSEDEKEHVNSGGHRRTDIAGPVSQSMPPLRENGFDGETTVLQNPQACGEEKLLAILEAMGQHGGRFTIPSAGAVLGKLPEAADIILPSPAVSRIHARIICRGEEYFVQDLNSRNGTCINGRPLVSQQFEQLKEQDEISFADLSYRFHREKGR